MRWIGVGLLAACAIFAALSGSAHGATNAEPLTIYSSLPLQGDSRPQSEDIVRAIEMALDDHGGTAGGHPISHVSLDDASPELGFAQPELVEANATRAAGDGSAIAYIGEFNSFASMWSIPILNEAGLLQVSPSNTYVGLTRAEGAEEGDPDRFYPTGRRTYGRVVPADHLQAVADVVYMLQEGCSNAFILNNGLMPPAGLAELVERAAAERGLKILGNDTIEPFAPNWRAAARAVKDAGADCVFYGGFTGPLSGRSLTSLSSAALLFKAIAAASPEVRFFGGDYLAERVFTDKLGPKLAPRVFFTNPTLDPSAYPPAGQAFFAAFASRYDKQPEPYAIYGYEAMSVILDAIDRAAAAGAVDRQAVVESFFATSGRASVLGTYDIDAYGDTTLPDYGGFRALGGEVVFDRVLKTSP